MWLKRCHNPIRRNPKPGATCPIKVPMDNFKERESCCTFKAYGPGKRLIDYGGRDGEGVENESGVLKNEDREGFEFNSKGSRGF